MADVQPPRDPDDELISQAFSSYRAAAPKNFPQPAAAELMGRADAARPTRKRGLTVSLAALAFTGLIAGGAAVAQTVASVSDGHVDRGDGNESTAHDDGGESSPAGPTKSPGPSHDKTDEDSLSGLKITLPDWPDADSQCPAGTYTFAKDGASEPDSDWAVRSEGTVTTLDDDGVANDLIVEIDCDELSGVIALERAEDTKEAKPKGFVDTASAPGTAIDVVAVEGKKVTVDTGVSTEGTAQETFVYDGEGFTQAPDDDTSDDPTTSSETPSDAPTSSSPPDSEATPK